MLQTARISSRVIGVVLLPCAFALGLGGGAGCTLSPSQACAPGDLASCPCAGDGLGYASCAKDGSGYGECNCTGARPWIVAAPEPKDAAADSATGGGPTLLEDASPCQSDAECSTNFCFPFNNKGPHCTRKCTQATAASDCPPPYEGCNNRGVCKVP